MSKKWMNFERSRWRGFVECGRESLTVERSGRKGGLCSSDCIGSMVCVSIRWVN